MVTTLPFLLITFRLSDSSYLILLCFILAKTVRHPPELSVSNRTYNLIQTRLQLQIHSWLHITISFASSLHFPQNRGSILANDTMLVETKSPILTHYHMLHHNQSLATVNAVTFKQNHILPHQTTQNHILPHQTTCISINKEHTIQLTGIGTNSSNIKNSNPCKTSEAKISDIEVKLQF